MQQILNIIFKNGYKLLFMLLLLFSFGISVQSHSYHKSKMINSANFISGSVYEKTVDVGVYFDLQAQNKKLIKENLLLKSKLLNKPPNIIVAADTKTFNTNSVSVIYAKIIKNNYSRYTNYLTLNAGSKLGVQHDMGVINDNGVVGIIESTSENYATVQSILNTNSSIYAKIIRNSDHTGFIKWDGKSTGFVQLTDFPRLAVIRKGDTIVTGGGQTSIFPENINIGTIDKIYTDNETNYYTIDVKLFNDMTNLNNVYIIKMKDAVEIKNLEAKTKNE